MKTTSIYIDKYMDELFTDIDMSAGKYIKYLIMLHFNELSKSKSTILNTFTQDELKYLKCIEFSFEDIQNTENIIYGKLMVTTNTSNELIEKVKHMTKIDQTAMLQIMKQLKY